MGAFGRHDDLTDGKFSAVGSCEYFIDVVETPKGDGMMTLLVPLMN